MKLRPMHNYTHHCYTLECSVDEIWWSSHFIDVAKKISITPQLLGSIYINNGACSTSEHYFRLGWKKEEDVLQCIEELEPYLIMANLTGG